MGSKMQPEVALGNVRHWACDSRALFERMGSAAFVSWRGGWQERLEEHAGRHGGRFALTPAGITIVGDEEAAERSRYVALICPVSGG